jgi:hypothetical protein
VSLFFKTGALPVKDPCCYNRGMVDDDKGKKDRGTKDRSAASEKNKTSKDTDDDEAGGEEDKLTPVKPKVGEPTGNLRRRAEWFRKRH